MNKTAAYLGIISVVLLGLVGAIVIAVFKPESLGILTSHVVTVLGIAITAAVTLYGLGKQGEKIEEIKHQTNGTLSKKDDEIARLSAELVEVNRKLHPFQDERLPGRHAERMP